MPNGAAPLVRAAFYRAVSKLWEAGGVSGGSGRGGAICVLSFNLHEKLQLAHAGALAELFRPEGG